MTKEEKVHLTFRDKKTGRYVAHIMFSKEEWALIESAAEVKNQSLEEFIIEAIEMFIRKNEEALGDR